MEHISPNESSHPPLQENVPAEHRASVKQESDFVPSAKDLEFLAHHAARASGQSNGQGNWEIVGNGVERVMAPAKYTNLAASIAHYRDKFEAAGLCHGDALEVMLREENGYTSLHLRLPASATVEYFKQLKEHGVDPLGKQELVEKQQEQQAQIIALENQLATLKAQQKETQRELDVIGREEAFLASANPEQQPFALVTAREGEFYEKGKEDWQRRNTKNQGAMGWADRADAVNIYLGR